jgi:hypothetical protein
LAFERRKLRPALMLLRLRSVCSEDIPVIGTVILKNSKIVTNITEIEFIDE